MAIKYFTYLHIIKNIVVDDSIKLLVRNLLTCSYVHIHARL